MALEESGKGVVLEVELQVIVRFPAGYKLKIRDAPGESFQVGCFHRIAEPVQVQAVLLPGFRRALLADLVGADNGAAGKGSGHLHAFRGRETRFLAEVDEQLVQRGPVGEADAFHAHGKVMAWFCFGRDMGHPSGPVIGPDLLCGKGEGGREDRQGKDRLFHHCLQIYTFGAGKRKFFVSLSG